MGKMTSRDMMRGAALVAHSISGSIRDQFARFMGAGTSHGGTRQLWAQFGYPQTITPESYFSFYERDAIASRIIRAFPAATWREAPILWDEKGNSPEKMKDGKANATYSPFAEAFAKLVEEFGLLHKLERADRLSGIAHYGALFLGFSDTADVSQPVGRGAKLLYLAPYGEIGAQIASFETNPADARFGLPKAYNLRSTSVDGRQVPSAQVTNVHPSRIIHIAEFLDDDEVYGQPRLKPILNRLMDIEKVIGGAAEVYWQNSARALVFQVDKDAPVLSDETREKMKSEVEDFANNLRKTIIAQGMQATSIAGEEVDPSLFADKLLDFCAGATGIPKRILLGTERGELSSSQDENNWALRIDERRKGFATHGVLKPFVQKMIDLGILPQPTGEWGIEWPEHDGLDPTQEAAVAKTYAEALVAYSNSPNAELVVPVAEFRRDFLGLPPESEFQSEELFQEEPIDENDPNLQDQPQAEMPEEDDAEEPATNASKPRTLYMHRKVLPGSASKIAKWAKEVGLRGLEDDLHVTIAYSRTAFDWTKIRGGLPFGNSEDGQMVIPAGGVRILEPIGPAKTEMVDGKSVTRQAIALLFVSDELAYRHMDIMHAGASHDFEDYQPHITLSYEPQAVDISTIKPFQGSIWLGPEDFGEIDG